MLTVQTTAMAIWAATRGGRRASAQCLCGGALTVWPAVHYWPKAAALTSARSAPTVTQLTQTYEFLNRGALFGYGECDDASRPTAPLFL